MAIARNTRRIAGGTAALAALAIVATACGSSSNATGSSNSTPAAPTSSSSAPTPAEPSTSAAPKNAVTIKPGTKPITVAIVPKLLGLPVFEANVKGAKQIAGSLHETIDYTASVQASGADQAQVIEGLVNSNTPPNVIAYSANDPTSIVPALKDAAAKGIKVIGFDSDVTASGRSYFIQDTAYDTMGKAVIDAVVAKEGNSGDIGIVSSTKDATVQNAWIDAMKTYMASAYPKLKLADIVYGQSNQATSQSQTTNMLNSDPTLKAIIPIDGAAVPGALAAIKSQGLTGQVGVFGIGDPNPVKQYFADGSLTSMFLWDEVKQGELIAYVARAVADGTMPKSGGSFVAGDLGAFTVTNDLAPNTVIFSNPLEFTKDNYQQYNF